MLLCATGLALFERYECAEREKNALRAHPLVTGQERQAAKQRYVETFADWLAHKAFCQDCKPKAPVKGELRSTSPGR
jgi:hypothetical protein